MKKILHIISSPRGEASLSIKLANAIIEKIKAVYPGSTVHENNLVKKTIPAFGRGASGFVFYTRRQAVRPENILAIKHSDEAIQEIRDARYYCNWCAAV
jgi:FMN-dependent NADH-azoreductase